MKNFDVHGKLLPAPSFFQVYNYGGGNGDKDREIVYAELTKDTPALVNYYYINNRKEVKALDYGCCSRYFCTAFHFALLYLTN